ncbi:MAG: ketol-acid reductoisomerase [Alphaproteobacteria bacterium]|nr:ketol-acid reductoisomerase [Alphaproteobacteria bacterium]MBV9692847.1 ketol-acid reductoisomerase [Alphaproteobacteria bacterium]
MKTYRQGDAELAHIRRRKVAIIGYGNQGRAHALNLRDSGVANIAIGARPGASADKARAEGFAVTDNAAAVQDADVVVMGAPDELLPAIYARDLEGHMKHNAALLFVHGFALHFALIAPRRDLDVLLVAPAGPGSALRANFLSGDGYIGLFAVHRDVTGHAKALALSYGVAIGCGAGLIETDVREETETDLFGEQAVLCGGSAELVRAAFDTLVEAGYAPALAYFECLHQLKLLVELMQVRGIAGMYKAISNTAEYGAYRSGPRLIDEHVRKTMREVLSDVQSGRFANDWVRENAAGLPHFHAMRAEAAAHPIEAVGEEIRAMMPWLTQTTQKR